MSSRFRSLTPNGERPKEDEIAIDLDQFEAELAASIAKFDGKRLSKEPPPENAGELSPPSRFPALEIADPSAVAQPQMQPVKDAPPSPPPAAAPNPTSTGAGFDLLSELRQAAEQKTVANAALENDRKTRVTRIDQSMRLLFRYLGEFSGHLNKIQPLLPQVFRPMPNIELSDLHWSESFVDYRTDGGTETSPLDSISLRYTLSAGNNIRVEKLPNHATAYLDELKRVGLRYTTSEKRGSRGLVEQIDFLIERAIVITLAFKVDVEKEIISLRARNFTGLGHSAYTIKIADLDQALLDELGKHILGRPNQLFGRMTRE